MINTEHIKWIANIGGIFFISLLWVYVAVRMIGRAVLRAYFEFVNKTKGKRRK